MKFHFTVHANQKFIRTKQAGFAISRKRIRDTIKNPIRIEDRNDDTRIAISLLDEHHVLRVVFRQERDIIIIITFYPGRRKAYAV